MTRAICIGWPDLLGKCQFLFPSTNYAYATRQGILTKIRACEQLQKFCEHEQASTHLIFASNSSKGQILRALSNWMGPFDTPNKSIPFSHHGSQRGLGSYLYLDFQCPPTALTMDMMSWSEPFFHWSRESNKMY